MKREDIHKEGEVGSAKFVAHQILLLAEYTVEYPYDTHYFLSIPIDRTRQLLVMVEREPPGLTEVWASNQKN